MQAEENKTDQEVGGVRGFLLLFIVFLVLQTLNTFFASISLFSDTAAYSKISGVLLVAYSGYGVLVIALIIGKSLHAKKHATILLCIAILLTLGFAISDYVVLEAKPTLRQGSIVLISVVWMLYLSHSRRVAATFSKYKR